MASKTLPIYVISFFLSAIFHLSLFWKDNSDKHHMPIVNFKQTEIKVKLSFEEELEPELNTPQKIQPNQSIILNPSPIGNIAPVYPKISRMLGEEGEVELQFIVLPEGKTKNITILKSSNFERLDQAAIKAIEMATFIPALKDNKPIEFQTSLNIVFTLKK